MLASTCHIGAPATVQTCLPTCLPASHPPPHPAQDVEKQLEAMKVEGASGKGAADVGAPTDVAEVEAEVEAPPATPEKAQPSSGAQDPAPVGREGAGGSA